MVDRTGIRELEISMSFIDLLEVCLEETTSYAASEHDVGGGLCKRKFSASVQEIRDSSSAERLLKLSM